MPKFKNRQDYENWKAARSGSDHVSDRESTIARTPKLVQPIGWGFVVLGSFLILNALGGLVKADRIQDVDFGNLSPLFDEIFQYLMVFSFLLVLAGFFVLIAGINFLILKAWARPALEGFSWFACAFVLGCGIFLSVTWSDTISAINASAVSNAAPPSVTLIGVVIIMLITLFISVLPVTAIILLRRESLRKVFARRPLFGETSQNV